MSDIHRTPPPAAGLPSLADPSTGVPTRLPLRQVALGAEIVNDLLRLHLVEIRKGTVTGAQLSLAFALSPDPSSGSRASAKEMLKFLGAAEILHAGQAEIANRIDTILARVGLLPLDNPIIDILEMMRRLNAHYDGSMTRFELADLCAHARVIVSSEADLLTIEARARAIAEVHVSMIAGGRAQLATRTLERQAPSSSGPGPAGGVLIMLAAPPLPDPGLPDIVAQSGPWRAAPWTDAERGHCARLFRSGVTIETISAACRRRPGAIHARLVLDGVIAPDETARKGRCYVIDSLFR